VHNNEAPAFSWTDKSLLLLGTARKSSGLRMWQGGQQQLGTRRGPSGRHQPSSAGSSRSPSPSNFRDPVVAAVRQPPTAASPSLGASHATLPRTSSSAASRLKGPVHGAPAAPQQNPNQRRSYGGGITSLLPPSTSQLSAGRHASAPTTPRQSSNDLRAISPARSSSPAAAVAVGVDSRRRSAHYPLRGADAGSQYEAAAKSSPTRAVSERSLHHAPGPAGAAVGPSSLRYFGGSHQSLLSSQAGPESGASRGSGLARPRGAGSTATAAPASRSSTAPQQTQHKQLQQQNPSVQSSRSRLPASHRGGFGFNQK
jgi:hypothetical protein